MSMDAVEGIVRWQPRSDQQGNHMVEIAVEDRKGGEATQRFELTLDLEPSVPANSAD